MNWSEWFMGFAEHAATKSKDTTQVGAALVGPDKDVRLVGFNGIPRGVIDSPERRERPTKYLFTCHAEANALAWAARRGISTEGCSLYVTHFPCAQCAALIIQSGIKRVVFGEGKTSMPDDQFLAADLMFREAGVQVFPHRR